MNPKGSKTSIHSQCSFSFLFLNTYHQEFVVQPVSRVRLFETPWTAAFQASLSFTTSQSFLQLEPIESVKPTNNRARNSNVSVDANGLVTFKGTPEPAHVHVNYKGYVYPVAFNLTKGYYRETYNSASLTDNAWYSKNPWANSKHKSQDPEMTASALKVYPQATDKGTYKQYRCDMIKTCSSSSPVYLNIDYPIVCFHIDDVADLKAVNRNKNNRDDSDEPYNRYAKN